MNDFLFCREEADVEEYLTISGDHDHYISSETIVLQNESVAYEEETTCQPANKKRKFFTKYQHYKQFIIISYEIFLFLSCVQKNCHQKSNKQRTK